MSEPEVIYSDSLAKRLFDVISETRSPTVDIDWDHLSASEKSFYRDAAHKLQASGAMHGSPLDDSAAMDDDDEPEDVIKLDRALTVKAISVGILRDETGQPALVGHFGGHQRDEPDKSVGVAFMMSTEGVSAFIRQVIGASMAVDPKMAAHICAAAVAAMQEATVSKPHLTIPAIRPHNLREN